MKYLTKKHASLLVFGCWLVYTAAYVGRLNYSASMAEIIDALGITDPEGGLVYSCFAITYGIGQLINGLLCKFYNPKYVITAALCGSAAVNILMPLSGDYRIMAGLWLVNGIVQSMLYSLIVRTISKNIKSSGISGAIYAMSTTVAVGTALAYGISALFVALDAWGVTFFVAGGVLISASVVWFVIMSRIEGARKRGEVEDDDAPQIKDDARVSKSGVSGFFLMTIVFVGISAVANGFIKDGINNWLPKLLRVEYGVPDSLSIILTLLLPIFSIFGSIVARKLYLKLHNHMLVNGIFYSVSFVLAFLVFLTYPMRNVPFTMILFIGLACMMAAVNNVITSMFPLDNRDKMDSGLLAGLMDTVCYAGSSLAGILLGFIMENRAGEGVLVTVFSFAIAAALLCMIFYVSTRKMKK